MADYTGNRVVNGSFGRLWIDNEEVMEIKDINASVTSNTVEVVIGSCVDEKQVSTKCEGSFVVHKVKSRGSEILKSWAKGKDKRVKLTFQIADPDTENEQLERWTIKDVWFKSIQIAGFSKGAIVEEEFPFGFRLDNVDIEEEIK